VLEAITALESTDPAGSAATQQRYLDHLQKQPSLMAAARWLAGQGEQSPLPAPVQKSLEQATRPLARYRCAACGFEAKEHFWHCPGCQAWDSYPPRRVEEL
jgi:lipopolysaccharide biosynthesis regulator YciM